ncbi:MAG: ferritin family protein [Chloroflexi bacterium]|nr:ferritin family protein [Chloroflexota bacterium]MBU1746135.1 ferritin family protein [Chloroflexota bacterium]
MADENCSQALSALAEAIEMEKRGQAFYLDAAAEAVDPLARTTLTGLAADEVEHVRLLETQYQAVEETGQWACFLDLGPKDSYKPQSVFPDTAGPIEDLTDRASAAEVLEQAMQFEEKGYQLYKAAADGTDDLEGKAVYEYLAKQEDEHYRILQQTHEYLLHPDRMFDDMERPMFEG